METRTETGIKRLWTLKLKKEKKRGGGGGGEEQGECKNCQENN